MTVPAIIYIDTWGRRPMLLAGTAMMGFFLMLVGGLQGHYGHRGTLDDGSCGYSHYACTYFYSFSSPAVWLIENNDSVTKAVIVMSYFFVSSFAITMGPVSWTYPAEIFPNKVRGKAVSLSTAANWIFNFALAWAVPPALENIAWKTYLVFGTFNFGTLSHLFSIIMVHSLIMIVNSVLHSRFLHVP